jgi:hypothetical protein
VRLLLLLAALASPAVVPLAHAGPSKAEMKAAVAAVNEEARAMYPGPVWALKDLPVYSGATMNIPWIGPIAEVSPEGVKIDANTVVSATYASVKTVWYGARANEKLTFKEATLDDDGTIGLAFVGVDGSKGHDTKVRVRGAKTLAEVKGGLDQILSVTSPIDPTWPEDVKAAIAKRAVVNGMTKRQAYLVVGEPASANVQEIGGKKIETWVTRNNNGMRIGFGATMELTGYPPTLRFEDGKLVGVTQTGAGVNLD